MIIYNILAGIGIMSILFLCLFTAYTVGLRHAKKSILDKRTEQEELELERQRKGFDNIMNFDMDVALGRRANK